MKNINQYFQYLYSLERAGMKYDLSNITTLCKALGNPQDKFRSIHIAGTNGKGATASFTASVLMEHGLKTGLFTSPHILQFNERIRVGGKCISNTYIKKFLEKNIKLIKRIKPSFFEVNTAMAFKYFADKKVEAAVIECGLGGRLDSTNILKPVVSAITQIDMDHMQFLGNTLREIALEKLGIVKNGVKVIVSDNNRKLVSLFHKSITENELLYIDDIARMKVLSNSNGKLKFTITPKSKKSITLTTPLPGKYQVRNAAAGYFIVKQFLFETGNKFHLGKFKKGISDVKKNTGYFGRLELIKKNGKQYLLDVSHNPDGIKNAITSVKNTGFKPEVVIFGIMSDKDHNNVLKQLLPFSKNIIFTKPDYERAQEPGILYSDSLKIKGTNNLMLDNCVKGALKIADKLNYKRIMILGSFFMVSDALKALGIHSIQVK
ncbi:MAG TPA: folylpolyglutamate synthase/dihydrofolate synthase family protein [Ignavibacteria bacterium]|nr:folylpolyglutamate synthase/dihydrofolate synthase family protein [Ignavibacteria bacterium]HMR00163.1 folylpolyglutamate synthase/dihydrofolate synthase family protein [Ignavibacteria bacterium]